MSTKRISTLILVVALLLVGQGCATRKQQAVDRSMLIQENLQLDQALSITQYELMLARQENETLRAQLEQSDATGSGTPRRSSPTLRSVPELSNGGNPAPSFELNDPNLPPPSNGLPSQFLRPQNPLPSNAPQWAPQRH